MPATNFNYQVALTEGLRSLQQGRLRQAEQSFRYLVEKFPGAEGGYRGLAKVHFEQEDKASALHVLRDGAAALAKVGERTAAIGLLREAVALDRGDLTTHRRLAAALALAGDADAALEEYVRFIRDLRDAGETAKALSEATYAVGQLRDVPGVASLARIAVRAPAQATPPSAPPPNHEPERLDEDEEPARIDASREPPVEAPIRESRAHTDSVTPAAELAAAANGEGSAASYEDLAAVETAATLYLGSGDPRSAEFALEAARRYLAQGRIGAASDLLLQLIAAGVANHQAQRLLVEVARGLGKSEMAKAKCRLLVQAFRLDGREDLAAEVEALVQAD